MKFHLSGAILLAALMMFSGCERTSQKEFAGEDAAPGEVESEEELPHPEEPQVERIDPEDIGPPAPAIYFTTGLKGYTEPCGCTADVLLGGIDRITAFGLDAMGLHEEAIFIDGGDWLFEYADLEEALHAQEREKATVLARAHQRLGTRFSVPGERDLALGSGFYLEMMERADMAILSVNLSFSGEDDGRTAPSHLVEFEDYTIRFVGVTDPELVGTVENVEAREPIEGLMEALDGVSENEVVALVYQGTPEGAQALLEAVPRLDLVVLGHNPELRKEPRELEGRPGFEAYDQGRYVGRLKLYNSGGAGHFQDARAGVEEERKSLSAQIAHVEQDLRLLEVRTGGESNPLMKRLQERLDGLQERQEVLMREGIEVKEGAPTFLFDLIAMDPGYRLDEEMQALREAYNRSLAALNRDVVVPVVEVGEGEPFYIGTDQCAVCHVEAHQFWEQTNHASAVETLAERDKEFDQNCIGCHVVGWNEPGGSAMGNIVYEAELAGRTFEKDLRDVGCESCHGPGSNHRMQPLNQEGIAQHIIAEPTVEQCTSCHVPEHSPRFEFDVYVREITGEGHELRP